MAKAWRCNHHLEVKDHKSVSCANCGKRIVWASINNSEKIGFWLHLSTNTEQCAQTVATPYEPNVIKSECYHDKSVTKG